MGPSAQFESSALHSAGGDGAGAGAGATGFGIAAGAAAPTGGRTGALPSLAAAEAAPPAAFGGCKRWVRRSTVRCACSARLLFELLLWDCANFNVSSSGH